MMRITPRGAGKIYFPFLIALRVIIEAAKLIIELIRAIIFSIISIGLTSFL